MKFRSFFKFFSKMFPKEQVLVPVGVRGMTVLDREKFARSVEIPVLKVKMQDLAGATKVCKPIYLKLENFKPIQDADDNETEYQKHIYLDVDKIRQWLDLDENIRLSLFELGITVENYMDKEVKLGYVNWSCNTIFKAVLPENEDIVSSYTNIGHIIHLNLRDHLLQYRSLIGQVFLDKIKNCRTVVNKSNIIDNTYRNFKMEVIAGEETYVVTVKESNCIFEFDFSKVYWNSRLGMEHERILHKLNKIDVLFDVFCGVGPFSVPAAKKGCRVYANDLNPDSFQWLNHNAKKNKLKGNFLSYNLDGKDFICNNFRDFIIGYLNGTEVLKEDTVIHVTMNLPAMAVEFLKYFKGLIGNEELIDKFKCQIIVYVYCFVSEDPVNAAKKLVLENFGCDMNEHILEVFNVRKVSPKKDMMRVTIKLVKDILFSRSDEPPAKKVCT